MKVYQIVNRWGNEFDGLNADFNATVFYPTLEDAKNRVEEFKDFCPDEKAIIVEREVSL